MEYYNKTITNEISIIDPIESLYDNDYLKETTMRSEFNLIDLFHNEPNLEENMISSSNIENVYNNHYFEKLINVNHSQSHSQKKNKQIKIKFNVPKIGKIFKIAKFYKNKKKGRIKKKAYSIGKHNKFSEDNIITKIKKRFIEQTRKYINYKYNQYLLKNQKQNKKAKTIEFLKRISPNISGQMKKRDNIKWLNLTLAEAYSVDISKYHSEESDYNIKNINKLYEEGLATEVTNLLNRKVKDVFQEYCSNEKKEGFKKLNDDLEEMRNNMIKEKEEQIDEYINKYKYIAMNFENIFLMKTERKESVKIKRDNN